MTADEHSKWQELANSIQISTDEIAAFHHSHFSAKSVATFAAEFLALPSKGDAPQRGYDNDWEEDDGLGFYSDGGKRTLTDEQIEIFRHSELRELQKQQENANSSNSTGNDNAGEAEVNESSTAPIQNTRLHSSRVKKKRRKGGRGVVHEPKPDLRKRTWDVVDAGLDFLDYD